MITPSICNELMDGLLRLSIVVTLIFCLWHTKAVLKKDGDGSGDEAN